MNYVAPGPETLFDAETDEPTLTGLWDELVGVENTRSSSSIQGQSKNGEEKERSTPRAADRDRGDVTTTTTIAKSKEKEENRGIMGMEKGKGMGMIILVGFSELIYQGFSPEYLARFGRALLGWCRQVSLPPSPLPHLHFLTLL